MAKRRTLGAAIFLFVLAIAVWVVTNETTLEPGHVDAADESSQYAEVVREGSTREPPPEPAVAPFVSEPGAESAQPTEWPVPPATLESKLVSALLGLPELENVVVHSAECSRTACEVRVTASNADRNYYPVVNVIVNDLVFPSDISFRVVVELAERFSRDFDILRIDTDLGTPLDPSVFPFGAEFLQEIARNALIDSTDPLELFQFDATDGEPVRVLLEEVCESDCFFGSRRMIYLDVSKGQACSDLQGVEQDRLVGTETGGAVERTFCVPNTLVP